MQHAMLSGIHNAPAGSECYVQYGTCQCYPKLLSIFGVLLGKSLLVTSWRKALMWSTLQAVILTQVPLKSITNSGLLGKSRNCKNLLLGQL